jgi:hypothetical protein
MGNRPPAANKLQKKDTGIKEISVGMNCRHRYPRASKSRETIPSREHCKLSSLRYRVLVKVSVCSRRQFPFTSHCPLTIIHSSLSSLIRLQTRFRYRTRMLTFSKVLQLIVHNVFHVI